MCFDHAAVVRKGQRRCREMYHEPVNDNDMKVKLCVCSLLFSFPSFTFSSRVTCLVYIIRTTQ